MLENMFTALISNYERASLLYITASRILLYSKGNGGLGT